MLSSPNFFSKLTPKLIHSAHLWISGPYTPSKGVPTMSLWDRANKQHVCVLRMGMYQCWAATRELLILVLLLSKTWTGTRSDFQNENWYLSVVWRTGPGTGNFWVPFMLGNPKQESSDWFFGTGSSSQKQETTQPTLVLTTGHREPAPTGMPSTGCQLLLGCGWTSTELTFSFILVTNSVRNWSQS